MFENIINQKAVEQIAGDIIAKKVPQSILFSGAENSAKLTTAMELARVLSCTKNAEWTCDCPSCKAMRSMKSVDLLIIGHRDLTAEIKASAKTFLKMKTRGSSFLFMRAVKKLLIRFDPRLWDTDESRFIKASPLVSETQQLLNDTFQFLEKQNTDKVTTSVEKIITLAEKTQETMYETIPVNQVRKASNWIRLSPVGKYKFLIIENAERMQESARTAFLKILEEPPRHAFFILTSTRPSAIMQTILSRVRRYIFLPRSNKDEVEIITRVFHDEIPATNENILDRYFQNFLSVPFGNIKQAAFDFWFFLFENYCDKENPLCSVKNFIIKESSSQNKSISQIIQDVDKLKNPTVLKILLEEIAGVLQKVLNSNIKLNALEVENFYHTTKIILKWKTANNIYNLSPQVVLESMAMEISELS